MSPLQADLSLTLGFIAVLMSDFSASHISKTLAGISFFLKSNNIVPVHDNFLVKQALKGYRKNLLI